MAASLLHRSSRSIQPARTDTNIICRNSTLTDVSFERTQTVNVTILNCNWNNVSFVDCQLADVDFNAVIFEDVIFHNVDFRKTRFHTMQMRNNCWRNMFTEHRVFGDRPIHGHVEDQQDRMVTCLLSQTSKPKARFSCLRPKGMSNLHSLVKDQEDATIPEKRRLKRTKTHNLLDLPLSVLDIILDELFPPCSLNAIDVSLNDRPDTRQTTYETTRSDGQHRRETYAMVRAFDASGQCTRLYSRFLLVSKCCYELAVVRLYDRPFHFWDSAEGCLAFLHDHRRKEHVSAELTIKYYPRAVDEQQATNLDAWRRLFNVLVHERADLNRVGVIIARSFWDIAPWQRGAHAVMESPGTDTAQTTTGDPRNFLQHVARLPATSNPRTQSGRVEFCLLVESFLDRSFDEYWDDPIRMAFSEDLDRHLREQYMNNRPALAKARYGFCTETELERSCYWKKPTSANEGGCHQQIAGAAYGDYDFGW